LNQVCKSYELNQKSEKEKEKEQKILKEAAGIPNRPKLVYGPGPTTPPPELVRAPLPPDADNLGPPVIPLLSPHFLSRTGSTRAVDRLLKTLAYSPRNPGYK
jgi:hypothetical protein